MQRFLMPEHLQLHRILNQSNKHGNQKLLSPFCENSNIYISDQATRLLFCCTVSEVTIYIIATREITVLKGIEDKMEM